MHASKSSCKHASADGKAVRLCSKRRLPGLDLSSGRPDCMAGHVGLELRNIGANYPFERSHGFPASQPNSGHGDYSRLSCGVRETQLVPDAGISAGMLARVLVDR
jgi:hypothetical protein